MNKELSLNEATRRFILDFERNVPSGKVHTNKELVQKFKNSLFFNEKFKGVYRTGVSKAIGWALKRSPNWDSLKQGKYMKKDVGRVEASNQMKEPQHIQRDEYIRYLSENLYQIIQLKSNIADETLKKYHLSSKGLGDDLYYLTEGYYRKKGTYHGKHSMSDFITENAREALRSKGSHNLIYEHMVPKNLYLNEIAQSVLDGTLTKQIIFKYLAKYYYVCTVTREEDKLLPSISMNDGWDSINPFYRYEQSGIRFSPNR